LAGATVTIGGTECTSPTVVDSTSITCTIPYHFASVVDVVVLNTSGITGTLFNGFSYNSYLYASNQSGASALSRMRIDSLTGNITQLGTTAVPNGTYGVDVDSTNTWVYSAGVSADQIAGFTINHATGDLTAVPGSPYAAGNGVDAVAVSKDSKFLIASNFLAVAGVAVTSYIINQSTGALTKVSDYAGGTQAGFIAIDPFNRFVFVTNYGSDNISAYTLNTTNCTLGIIGTYASGDGPDAISVHPTGKFLYAGNASNAFVGGKGAVTAMSIDQSTGALTLIDTYLTADARNGSGVEIDKTGSQVYVTARGNDAAGMGRAYGYNINTTNGVLTEIGNWVTGDGPNDVRILGDGKFVFTANTAANSVSVFVRDLATGLLTPASPASYVIGNGPGIIGITF
ncbi:MAG: beta-propeller fold lactonase family protein, partial [Bdellovibrionota bacterium]